MTYDSRPDTYEHILKVAFFCHKIAEIIMARGLAHDRSKTTSPELEVYDEFTPKLAESTYGSEEYKGFLRDMGAGLKHHYQVNRHHPEHFKNGVTGMTLIDLVEMLADWKAATMRHKDGSLERSLEIQKERFEISDQLAQILHNTAEELGWL